MKCVENKRVERKVSGFLIDGVIRAPRGRQVLWVENWSSCKRGEGEGRRNVRYDFVS